MKLPDRIVLYPSFIEAVNKMAEVARVVVAEHYNLGDDVPLFQYDPNVRREDGFEMWVSGIRQPVGSMGILHDVRSLRVDPDVIIAEARRLAEKVPEKLLEEARHNGVDPIAQLVSSTAVHIAVTNLMNVSGGQGDVDSGLGITLAQEALRRWNEMGTTEGNE